MPERFAFTKGSAEIDLRAALNSLPHGLTITDAAGTIVYYNDVQGEIDGLKREEVVGRHVSEVYVPSLDNSPTLAVLRTHQPIYDFFLMYETRKGKIINSTHTVLPLFQGGRLVGSICLIHPMSLPGKKLNESSQAAVETVQFANLIGSSPAFRSSINAALAAADSPSSVLIYGETGSGKELLARQLHEHSQRSPKPYVAVNCSAIPAQLLEGTMFGSVKGAFTGAQNSPGLFEEAHGGTVYLDEVDSMPLELQPKLLRAIQERKVRRVGSTKELDINIKLISSFSGDPLQAVREGRVRADLFYRLGVVIVHIPPLRERKSDLPGLVSFFINKHTELLKKKAYGISPEVMYIFKNYHWPGNVRELENVIEGAINMIGEGECIGLDHLPHYFRQILPGSLAEDGPQNDWGEFKSQRGVEFKEESQKIGRREVLAAMSLSRGSLKEAAARLRISRQVLAYRLKKYGLNRKDFEF